MELLTNQTAALNIRLTDAQVQQFVDYQTLLLAWNEQMNLTAIRKPGLIETKHFLDSLTCATVMGDLNGRSLLDLGTGAGFPGLPLKILFPDLRLTLVESIAKKTRFLDAVVTALGLTHVTIIPERAEILGHDPAHREHYDWVVARAVADLSVLLEYLLPFCRVGGHVLAQKGESAAAEIAAAAHAWQILGGATPQLHETGLPADAGIRHLVVVPKVAATPEEYPRRPGIPAKRPLGKRPF